MSRTGQKDEIILTCVCANRLRSACLKKRLTAKTVTVKIGATSSGVIYLGGVKTCGLQPESSRTESEKNPRFSVPSGKAVLLKRFSCTPLVELSFQEFQLSTAVFDIFMFQRNVKKDRNLTYF